MAVLVCNKKKMVLFLEDSTFLNFCLELAAASLPPISVCFPTFANWNSQGNVLTKIRNTVQHKAGTSNADKRNYILIPNGNSLVQDIADSKCHSVQHGLAQRGSRAGPWERQEAVQRRTSCPTARLWSFFKENCTGPFLCFVYKNY